VDEQRLAALDARFERFRREWMGRVRRAAQDASGGLGGRGAFRVLEVVLAHGPVSPSELADRVGVRTSTMTAHLDRLEEWGWAKRQPAPGPGSRMRVEVTARGREAFDRFLAARRSVMGDLLAGLPPDAVEGLERGLDAWAAIQSSEANEAHEGEKRS
jgi:DNA-binding MarR family transcriptional regulator